MKVLAVIPARLASTRLPRKALLPLAGRPMLVWVHEAVRKSGVEALVATDSEEIMQACNQHGVAARLTSTAHRSGTDRVNEIAQEVFADVYLNIQGDEPLVAREHIDQLVTLMQDESVQVGTLKTACAARDIANPNAVKVVTSADGRALYFSRATIPYARDASGARYFKHLGFYAYRRPALEQFCLWPESPLERSERLEQLRFLENGISIHVAESPYDTIGVDTEDDLRRVEEVLAARK